MSILKKLFGNNKEPQEIINSGDIFYTVSDNQYHLFKLLKEDENLGIYHVLLFEPVNELPTGGNINQLKILSQHVPIDKAGIKGAKIFLKDKINPEELFGYYKYLKQTNNIEELAPIANGFYKEGLRNSGLKQYSEAIKNYSKAIYLFPAFFEAIDNRAFCHMDTSNWNEAIKDFKLSLSVNPKSFLAEFSIGECLLRLKDFPSEVTHFENAINIDPTKQVAKDFLEKTKKLSEI